MSVKTQSDKTDRGPVSLHRFHYGKMTYGAHTVVFYPWTARQRRQKANGSRKNRKSSRKHYKPMVSTKPKAAA